MSGGYARTRCGTTTACDNSAQRGALLRGDDAEGQRPRCGDLGGGVPRAQMRAVRARWERLLTEAAVEHDRVAARSGGEGPGSELCVARAFPGLAVLAGGRDALLALPAAGEDAVDRHGHRRLLREAEADGRALLLALARERGG